MAVARSTEDIPAVMEISLGLACSLCEREMLHHGECVLTKCKHTFHRDCVTKWLVDSKECPNCGKLCHEKDFGPVGPKPVTKSKASGYRGRGRGSAVKVYDTRSSHRLQNDGNVNEANAEETALEINFNKHDSQQDYNISANCDNSQNPHNTTGQSNRNKRGNRNVSRMGQMIETTVQRMLSELNLSPWPRQSQQPVQPPPQQLHQPFQVQPETQPPQNFQQNNVEWNSPQHSLHNEQNQSPAASSNHIADRIRLSPDKVTAIIQSWNVKYDGASDGLLCEEFLYRIKCLVEETFNGNFNDTVAKNLHVLLTGKVKTWYWRYRKTVTNIVWDSFCTEFRKQYKDYRTTFDIREELHNRKQKAFEPFETFYDAINSIIDRLAVPLDEEELIETVIRNLRPEIRHELLYVQVRSIGHLKQLCQKREKLLNEESFKRNVTNRYPAMGQQRKVASVENNIVFEENTREVDDKKLVNCSDFEVNAIEGKLERKVQCWNCEEEGHFWDMCLKDRKVFCYGCGLRNVYKPQCVKCSNNSKNYRSFCGNRTGIN